MLHDWCSLFQKGWGTIVDTRHSEGYNFFYSIWEWSFFSQIDGHLINNYRLKKSICIVSTLNPMIFFLNNSLISIFNIISLKNKTKEQFDTFFMSLFSLDHKIHFTSLSLCFRQINWNGESSKFFEQFNWNWVVPVA